jgi:membrane fusion protein (multidrug efflux system)
MSNQTATIESDLKTSRAELPAPGAEPKASRPASAPTAAPRRKRFGLALLAVLMAGATIWGARVVHQMLTHEKTDNAYVRGSIHTISSRLSGVVQEVLVDENSVVTAGQPLVKLDSRDLEIRRDEARVAIDEINAQSGQVTAQLAEVEAQSRLSDAQVTEAAAQLAREEATSAKAAADLERADHLFNEHGNGVISRADYDAVKASLQTAVASADAARAALAGAQAVADSAKAKFQAARAACDAALAQKRVAETKLKDAELQLSYTTITAPAAGRISRKNVEVGDHLQPGQALFALVEPRVWIEANFKETQLARMRSGQPVEITVDAIPGRTFRGTVESFSPATGAQFALLPPDNASGNFTKVVQRVPVKIVFAPDSIAAVQDRVRPGLSTIVSVDVR